MKNTEPRAPARTFQDLIVWQKSHQLVLDVYKCSAGFPKTERFGLSQQLRESAVSVPANIAEGFKKRGKNDYTQSQDLLNQAEEVSRLLGAFSQNLLTSTF